MNPMLFQVKSFIYQRLCAAAERIMEDVENKLGSAQYEADPVGRSGEEVHSLQHQLDLVRKEPEVPLTGSTPEHGDQCGRSLMQEQSRPSRPVESDFSLNAELPGSSQTSPGLDSNDGNYHRADTDWRMFKIKTEQEEIWDKSETQETVFAPPEMVKSEPKTEVLYEIQPVILNDSATHSDDSDDSDDSDCSDRSDDSDSNEELVNSNREQTNTMKSVNNNKDGAILSREDCSAKYIWSTEGGKYYTVCYVCGKGFYYISYLKKHMKTHERITGCTVCGKKIKTKKKLVAHLKRWHKKVHFCTICGRTFSSSTTHKEHLKFHPGINKFVCQQCGKTCKTKANLIGHVRTHSGEKPYQCDVCGKTFTQRQNLTFHKKIHSGERPYLCSLCGKSFLSTSSFKKHMDMEMKRHKAIRLGKRSYSVHVEPEVQATPEDC